MEKVLTQYSKSAKFNKEIFNPYHGDMEIKKFEIRINI